MCNGYGYCCCAGNANLIKYDGETGRILWQRLIRDKAVDTAPKVNCVRPADAIGKLWVAAGGAQVPVTTSRLFLVDQETGNVDLMVDGCYPVDTRNRCIGVLPDGRAIVAAQDGTGHGTRYAMVIETDGTISAALSLSADTSGSPFALVVVGPDSDFVIGRQGGDFERRTLSGGLVWTAGYAGSVAAISGDVLAIDDGAFGPGGSKNLATADYASGVLTGNRWGASLADQGDTAAAGLGFVASHGGYSGGGIPAASEILSDTLSLIAAISQTVLVRMAGNSDSVFAYSYNIADTPVAQMRKFDLTGVQLWRELTYYQLTSNPASVCVDGSGNPYIGGGVHTKIRRADTINQ